MLNVRLTTKDVLPTKMRYVVAQQFKCAICSTPITAGPDSCLDHEHSTGLVRGALCRNCNGIEGKVKNLATRAKRDGTWDWWLDRLLAYVRFHRANPGNIIHPTHKTEDEKRLRRNKLARQRRTTK